VPNPFNEQVIEEFRANKGRMGGYFEDARLILLTTTGARTGAPHTAPVGYLPDGGDRILVIASAGGAPQHPDWYRNLLAHPEVTVDSGAFTYQARAEVLTGEDRDQAFARAVEAEPGWAAYQEKTDRVIPVVALHEIAQGGPAEHQRRLLR
jgi:deazaflavin-dependent oxidoreductase (nitroreductase family)